MANKNPSAVTQFKKGESGNPGGKPIGARNELAASFLKTLAKDFNAHGESVLIDLRLNRPDVYIKVIAELLPKIEEKTVDVAINATVEHLAVSVIDSRITEMLGVGAVLDNKAAVLN